MGVGVEVEGRREEEELVRMLLLWYYRVDMKTHFRMLYRIG